MHAPRHFYALVTVAGGGRLCPHRLPGHADPGFTLQVYAHLLSDDGPGGPHGGGAGSAARGHRALSSDTADRWSRSQGRACRGTADAADKRENRGALSNRPELAVPHGSEAQGRIVTTAARVLPPSTWSRRPGRETPRGHAEELSRGGGHRPHPGRRRRRVVEDSDWTTPRVQAGSSGPRDVVPGERAVRVSAAYRAWPSVGRPELIVDTGEWAQHGGDGGSGTTRTCAARLGSP